MIRTFVVSGITGNTGGAVARTLLGRGVNVRALVRDPAKARQWQARGVEIVKGDLGDAASLARAFEGANAAYVLNPPAYTSPDLFEHAARLADAIYEATRESRLPRLVVLSSVGAHLSRGTGNVLTNHRFETRLRPLETDVVFVRPAYFMQNWGAVAAAATGDGVLPSFLAPLDREMATVSATDIGRVLAGAMLDGGPDDGVIELEGPRAYSPNDAAEAFSKALRRPVRALAVPESDWPAVLKQTGFTDRTIEAWVEMFRGFNSGRVSFEGGHETRTGKETLDDAIGALLLEARDPSLGVHSYDR